VSDSNAGQSAGLRGRIATLERRAAQPHSDKAKIASEALGELKTACAQLEMAAEQIRDLEADQKRMQALARHHGVRVRSLLDFLPDAYLATGLDGVIKEANHAAADLLNVSPRFLTGRSLHVFLAGERIEFLAFLASLPETVAPSERPVRLMPRERHRVDAMVRVAVTHDPSGQVNGLQWMVRLADTGHAGVPMTPPSRSKALSRD
jgi:PAS domain-containing protein